MLSKGSRAVRTRTVAAGDASSAPTPVANLAVRKAGSLAPTVYCPPARVEECVRERPLAKTR